MVRMAEVGATKWRNGFDEFRVQREGDDNEPPRRRCSQQLIALSVEHHSRGTRQEVETDGKAKQIAQLRNEASQDWNLKPGAWSPEDPPSSRRDHALKVCRSDSICCFLRPENNATLSCRRVDWLLESLHLLGEGRLLG